MPMPMPRAACHHHASTPEVAQMPSASRNAGPDSPYTPNHRAFFVMPWQVVAQRMDRQRCGWPDAPHLLWEWPPTPDRVFAVRVPPLRVGARKARGRRVPRLSYRNVFRCSCTNYASEPESEGAAAFSV